MPTNVDSEAMRRLVAQLRGLKLSRTRAAHLAKELARVNAAACIEGARNDFNDQPMNFTVTLAALAKR